MKIAVRLFAILAERAGARSLPLSLPGSATVADAHAALRLQFPQLAEGVPSAAYAVNGEYVDAATPLHEGDELALIPPVSGG